MPENVLYALMFGWIPFVFVIVGLVMVIKSAKNIYQSKCGRIKVMGRCVEIQQLQEGAAILYRPVFEYSYNGRPIRACKLDYDYGYRVGIGTEVPIYIDKKHPDVVCEATDNTAFDIVRLVMGLFILFLALPFIIPVFIMLFFHVI